MQIAGSICSTCGKNIVVASSGCACTKCEKVYHKQCLQTGDCPQCATSEFIKDQEQLTTLQELEHQEELNKKDRWKALVLPIILIALGIIMILNPDISKDTSQIHGRRVLMKMLIMWLWGIPGGVILTGIGGLLTFSIFKNNFTKDSNKKNT